MFRYVRSARPGVIFLFLALLLTFPPTVSNSAAEVSDETRNLAGIELKAYGLPLEGFIEEMAALLDTSGMDALRERLRQMAATQGTFEGTIDGQHKNSGALNGSISMTVANTTVTGEFNGSSSTGDTFKGTLTGNLDLRTGKIDANYTGSFNRFLGGKYHDTISMKGPFKGRFEDSKYHGYWGGKGSGHWSAVGGNGSAGTSAPVTPGDSGDGAKVSEDAGDYLDLGTPSLEGTSGDLEVLDPAKKLSWWQKLKGTIEEITTGTTSAREWEKPKAGMGLEVGTAIRTGGKSATITFKDGTKFILKPNSRLDVTHGGFKVEDGHILYDFKKYGKTIKLESKRGRFAILGTSFSIESKSDNDVLKVLEGTVAVILLSDPTQATPVSAGEEIVVKKEALSSKGSFNPVVEKVLWDQTEKAAQ